MTKQALIQKTADWIHAADKIVAFSGAGISKESGISTYREPGGLWDRFPEGSSGGMMAVMRNHPDQASEILLEFLETLQKATPNPGHKALVDLEQMGYLQTIITQNVDNLHISAGSSRVYELHGNFLRLKCFQCERQQKNHPEEYFSMLTQIIRSISSLTMESLFEHLPRCSCGGKQRIDFVGFGESVQQLDQAINASENCNLMLILGTSGVVHPAAMLPVMAKNKGATLIEINPEKSSLSNYADLFIKGQSGKILPLVVDALKKNKLSKADHKI